MKSSRRIQEFITRLASISEMDPNTPQAYHMSDIGSNHRLEIEEVGENLVSVTHYCQQGENLFSREVVFFTSDLGWFPIETTRIRGECQVYAEEEGDDGGISVTDPKGQATLADFAENWARDLEAQGWLDRAQKWEPGQPTASVPPDLATLLAWMIEDDSCEATDGCQVELDGVCPHGCPSWPVKLGLV